MSCQKFHEARGLVFKALRNNLVTCDYWAISQDDKLLPPHFILSTATNVVWGNFTN